MPSWIGVVHAGNSRSVPETSTRQILQAPTAVRPSRSHNVGIYLPFAFAAWRMVCPSEALISSPSIRIDNFFCGNVGSFQRALAHHNPLDVATKAAAGFIHSFLLAQPRDYLFLRAHAIVGGRNMSGVATACTRLFWRSLFVFKLGIDAAPAVRSHQLEIDVARGLFSISHGIRNIGSACDQVAPGIEAWSTGFQRESVDLN